MMEDYKDSPYKFLYPAHKSACSKRQTEKKNSEERQPEDNILEKTVKESPQHQKKGKR